MRKQGFTLIELLVVMAIISILLAVVRPMLSTSSNRTREFECESRLKQIAIAMQSYVEDYGAFPAKLGQLDPILQDKNLLVCSKTSRQFHYVRPRADANPDTVILTCVDRHERWPHDSGDSCMALTAGGGVRRLTR